MAPGSMTFKCLSIPSFAGQDPGDAQNQAQSQDGQLC